MFIKTLLAVVWVKSCEGNMSHLVQPYNNLSMVPFKLGYAWGELWAQERNKSKMKTKTTENKS